MVAPPATGGLVSSAVATGASNSQTPISRKPANSSNITNHVPNQPFSMRKAPPLDMSTVERRGQPSGSREKTKRTRPHGLQEAPTFRPTIEEFADPIEYIHKIAPEAKKYGICKIIPPDEWDPEFAIDTTKFHFRTRKQELNSIEGSTRTNLNYLDQLSKFHKQFGNTLIRFPSVDKRPLDLYKLKKAVEGRGGFDRVCKLKKWAEIGRDLGYTGKIMSSLSTSLKGSYQRWLAPYEEWVRLAKPSLQQMMEMEKAGIYTPPTAASFSNSSHATPNGAGDDSPISKPLATPSSAPKSGEQEPMDVDSPAPPPARPSSGFMPVNATFTPVNGFTAVNTIISTKREDSSGSTPQRSIEDGTRSKHGTPDVVASTPTSQALKRTLSRDTNGSLSEIDSPGADDGDSRGKKRQKKESSHTVAGSHPSLLKPDGTPKTSLAPEANSRPGERCEACGRSENPAKLVICDSCDNGCHRDCIDPPLKHSNSGWHCHKCLMGTGEFGFQEGGIYSLKQFQEKANKFKEDYFAPKTPYDPILNTKRQVTEDEVEKEFWRLVESLTETVEVEYGADVHSTTHGSGFPDYEKDPSNPYALDPWNLNVLPLHPESLFRHIKSDISGMTVPWLYVGMVFSTFCWHNEDHYTYSANYQHFGATKTWYGIPGEDAARFEQAMKDAVPELFEQQPDLLFQLVTLLPPNRLQKAGVNVYALDQRAGQFVITFPQAYHAGFNHGFNFNEAVNFAPSDWEPFGQAGVERLQEFQRQACFSHDELLMNAAARDTSIKSAKWLAPALEKVLIRELAQRSGLMKRHQAIDSHECESKDKDDVNETNCKLSVEVNNEDLSEDEYPCAHCKAYTYLSRYRCKTSGKIMCLLHAGSYACCEVEENQRYSSPDHVLVYKLSDNDLKETVQKVYDRARQPQLWQEKFDNLVDDDPTPPLKQLRSLVSEGERIPYDLPGLPDLKAFVDRCNEWVEEATAYITRKQQNRRKNERAWRRGTNNANKLTDTDDKEHRKIENIERLLDQAEQIGFDCPEIATLKERQGLIAEHRKSAQAVLANPDMHSTEAIEALAETGKSFNVDVPEVEKLELYLTKRKWVDEANSLREQPTTLPQVNDLLERATATALEEEHPLRRWWIDQKDKGEVWERKAVELMSADQIHYHQLEALCNQARVVPVTPETLAKVDAILVKQREAHEKIKTMNEQCKDPDFRKRPNYKDVRAVLDSLQQLCIRPSGVVDLEKDVKRNEDWMRRGKKLFGKSNAPLHILGSHMLAVKDRNVNCFNIDERPSVPVEPSSREASPAGSDPGNTSGKAFCLCRLAESGQMIECDICHEWYHSRCLKLARGKVKDDDKYACPICDHRQKIPRDAARPKLEDLIDWKADIPKLPFQPEEEALLDEIIDKAQEFRTFVAPWCHPDGDQFGAGVTLDIVSKRFYLRKIEGADILLTYETNYLRQELYKLVPIAPEAPPIMIESNSTRKPRPTKQQKLMAQLGITNPDDLPQELRTKQHTFKHLEKKKSELNTPRAPQPSSMSSSEQKSLPGSINMASLTRPAGSGSGIDPTYANMFSTSPTMSPHAWQRPNNNARPGTIDRPHSPLFRAPDTPPPASVPSLDPSLFSPSNGGLAAAALREVNSMQSTASPRFGHSRGTSQGGDMDNLFANFTNEAAEESNQAGEALEGLGIRHGNSSPAPDGDPSRGDDFMAD